MTNHRELKDRVRRRMEITGESYAAARAHVMKARAQHLGLESTSATDQARPSEANPAITAKTVESLPERVEAIVLKVNERSARVRILGEPGEVTLRAGTLDLVVPGHVITVSLKRRWRWRGDAYASGTIEARRIDIDALGLVPLPVRDFGLMDLRRTYEPFRHPEPYAPLWRKLTAKPRQALVMDKLAEGVELDEHGLPVFRDSDPVCDAVELRNAGYIDEAIDLLMDLLHRDLRCLDAHAHLGTFTLDLDAEQALAHYEVGRRIGELSLPPRFDGVLVWGRIENRPFLRCLQGEGLALWRLDRFAEAERVFLRLLSFSPNDNQGARDCLLDVRAGLSWAEANRIHEEERIALAKRFAAATRLSSNVT